MIKELIKLAEHLDKRGLHKEADYVDWLIKNAKKLEDLSGDGKVTKKDFLIGAGVLDEDGKPIDKKKNSKSKKSKPKKNSWAD